MADPADTKELDLTLGSSPQIRYPDYYGIDMARLEEFCAFRATMELIEEHGLCMPNWGDLSFYKGDLPVEGFLIFETVFCATSATIVSGAMAERTKFSMYLIYSAVISLFIYPIEGHWTWGGGWLCNDAEDGFMMTTFGDVFHDFAGSAIVHSVGGVLALIGAMALGPSVAATDDEYVLATSSDALFLAVFDAGKDAVLL